MQHAIVHERIQVEAHDLPPYQLSSNNFNFAAIGVKIRSKGRSDNFTKYVIAKCDFEWSLIYDPALSIY